jgi:hypothetical protein
MENYYFFCFKFEGNFIAVLAVGEGKEFSFVFWFGGRMWVLVWYMQLSELYRV